MRYEHDIAWRYLQLPAIGRFYLGLLVVGSAWAAFYLFLLYAIWLLQGVYPDAISDAADDPASVGMARLGGLCAALALAVLFSFNRRRGAKLRTAVYLVGLVAVLFVGQKLAVLANMLDEFPQLDIPLLVATGIWAGHLLRPTLRVPFITVLTSTSMFGVALGVAAIIVVLSVMNGFDKDFHKKILGVKSHVVVVRPAGITEWQRAAELLRSLPGTESAHPVAEGLALIRAAGQTRSVLVRGLDPSSEPEHSFLRRAVRLGSLDDLAAAPSAAGRPADGTEALVDLDQLEPESVPIFIGNELAKLLYNVVVPPDAKPEEETLRLESVLGQEIRIVAAEIGASAMGISTTTVLGRVAGIFATKFYDFDSSMIFVGLETGQYLYGLGGNVNRIEVRLQNYQPDATRRYAMAAQYLLHKHLNQRFYVDTWMDMDRIFYESLVIERRVMGLILSIIVLVASCSILTTLVMVVMEKTRDIGVLRAIGATQSSVMSIFVTEGMLIGMMGTLAGCVLAVIVCWLIVLLEITLPGGNTVYYIDRLPVQMEVAYFVNVVLYTVLLSFVATLYPAYRASRLVPVEAIRYE